MAKKVSCKKFTVYEGDLSSKNSLKIKNNWPILPQTPILECVCAALETSENKVGRKLREFEICNSAGKKLFSF